MNLVVTLPSLSWEFDTADHSFPLPGAQAPDFFPDLIAFSFSVSIAELSILNKLLKGRFLQILQSPFLFSPSLSHSSLDITATDVFVKSPYLYIRRLLH